jgi:hypothetical protein
VSQFHQRVSEYVELATEVGMKLPGPGASPFPAARSKSAEEGAWPRASYGATSTWVEAPLGTPSGQWRLCPYMADADWDGPQRGTLGLLCNHPEAGFCIVLNSQMTLGRRSLP